MNGTLAHKLVSPEELGTHERKRMYSLMAENYDCMQFPLFEKDLAGKDFVSLLTDQEGIIQGFSTYAVNPGGTGGEGHNILFSGDTIIAPAFWGSRILAKSWAQVVGALLVKYPSKKLYWFLISKGHRTFMYLPIFFNEFVPHPDMEGKEGLRKIAVGCAEKMFGDNFNPDTGLIEFDQSLGQVNADLAKATNERQQNEWIDFFVKKNPWFEQGVELVCLTEICEANMKAIGWRMVKQGIENPIF